MKNQEGQIKISGVSLTNRLQDTEERISGVETRQKNSSEKVLDSSVKENVKSKNNTSTKHLGNPWHHEKTKTMKNKDRKRRMPYQRHI